MNSATLLNRWNTKQMVWVAFSFLLLSSAPFSWSLSSALNCIEHITQRYSKVDSTEVPYALCDEERCYFTNHSMCEMSWRRARECLARRKINTIFLLGDSLSGQLNAELCSGSRVRVDSCPGGCVTNDGVRVLHMTTKPNSGRADSYAVALEDIFNFPSASKYNEYLGGALCNRNNSSTLSDLLSKPDALWHVNSGL